MELKLLRILFLRRLFVLLEYGSTNICDIRRRLAQCQRLKPCHEQPFISSLRNHYIMIAIQTWK